ncbi:MAG: substrate-binding domain-containing protein [Dissulfurispiraceae bacterium]|jgi:tungstate transport system substrate-binding protein|nr:substrate-binding domain-containing protein [Dissulfurispiraceae bacterium]
MLKLASTIGPIDAGIVNALEDAYKQKTGIHIVHTAAGSGRALQLAETGEYDLVLVHAKTLEEKFIRDGFGTQRYDLMYNDFVILGPQSDPSGISMSDNAAAAFRMIAKTQAPFITRGDNSGTHIKELEIWSMAKITPSGAWYIVSEHGSKSTASTLMDADSRQAYTIMDRATYITLKSKLKLRILVEKDEILLNYMTLIPVNPAKFPKVNYKEAIRFIEWLQSREAQMIIRDFGRDKYNELLFFPNSPEGKKL